MSLSKIIIIFVVILLVFGGVLFYQFSQASIPTSKATFGERTFLISVARTPEEMQKGLSGRNSLPKDQGMIFVFEQPGDPAFWMKDMKFPLDMVFINNDKIVSIAKNAKPAEANDENPPLYTAGQQVDKVLEINGGLADEYKLKVGDTVKLELKESTTKK